MHASWERTALQNAADQVVVRSTLKVSGIAATAFGLLAVFAGILPPTDPLLLGVGAALTLVGLWNLTNPSPLGLALTAGALILVGLYNVGSGFLEAAAGVKPFIGWQILGVWQVIWGVQGFGRWKRFQNTWNATVSDEQRANAKRMIDELKKANPKTALDVIEMVTGGLSPKMIRARLMPEMALVLVAGGEDVRLVDRVAFDIESPDAKPGKHVKVTLRMDGVSLAGAMPVESWQRVKTWKQSNVGLQRAA